MYTVVVCFLLLFLEINMRRNPSCSSIEYDCDIKKIVVACCCIVLDQTLLRNHRRITQIKNVGNHISARDDVQHLQIGGGIN